MKSLRVLFALTVFAVGASLASADCGTCEKKEKCDKAATACAEKCDKAKADCPKPCDKQEAACDKAKTCDADAPKEAKACEKSNPPAKR